MKHRAQTCPVHVKPLSAKKTRFGTRWGCDVPGCTVASWTGSTSTPADDETRALRKECHARFDPLWQKGATFSRPGLGGRSNRRRAAYSWLAERLGLSVSKTHFGMFDAAMCKKALEIISTAPASKPNQDAIRAAMDHFDDLPDGAFFEAVMDTTGCDWDDIIGAGEGGAS